jgi:hypothetical protein
MLLYIPPWWWPCRGRNMWKGDEWQMITSYLLCRLLCQVLYYHSVARNVGYIRVWTVLLHVDVMNCVATRGCYELCCCTWILWTVLLHVDIMNCVATRGCYELCCYTRMLWTVLLHVDVMPLKYPSPFKPQWVLHVTPVLTLRNSTFCSQCVCIYYFSWISELTAVIFL